MAMGKEIERESRGREIVWWSVVTLRIAVGV